MRLTVALPSVGAPVEPDALKDYAQALEELGVDTLHVVDHVVYGWPGPDGRPRQRYRPDMWHLEALSTLAFVAACTQRVGLETGILILPQRPPALVAKQIATLDVLSKGRIRLGLGVGFIPVEYEAMGVPFRQRGARMDEAIEVLKKVWTADHIVHRGRFYSLDDVGSEPKPVQKPHPPLLLGAGAPAALARAGRVANGWIANAGSSTAHFAEGISAVKAAAKAAGREDEVTIFEAAMAPQSPDPGDNLEALRFVKAHGATDVLYWMGMAREPEIRTLEGKLRYVERLVKDDWPAV
jgi:probable F420-dependent oxidoreductase